jgi:hypothetical protein
MLKVPFSWGNFFKKVFKVLASVAAGVAVFFGLKGATETVAAVNATRPADNPVSTAHEMTFYTANIGNSCAAFGKAMTCASGLIEAVNGLVNPARPVIASDPNFNPNMNMGMMNNGSQSAFYSYSSNHAACFQPSGSLGQNPFVSLNTNTVNPMAPYMNNGTNQFQNQFQDPKTAWLQQYVDWRRATNPGLYGGIL